MRRRGLLLALAGSGCTLVDQRTFNPEAGKRPEVAKPPASPAPLAAEAGPTPLLSIRVPIGDVRGDVARAVAAARSRKPGVVFDVVELGPEESASGEAAGEVARLITADGVRADRVHLAIRPTAADAREVRVYIR